MKGAVTRDGTIRPSLVMYYSICQIFCRGYCFFVFDSFICFWAFCFFSFLVMLCLRCCLRAFSSGNNWELLFIAARGLLIAVTSLVAERGL